jgi:two-component system response regulator NreC
MKNRNGGASGPSEAHRVTPKEKEVLSLLAEGYKSAEVANKLSVSVSTVRTHELHLRRKFDVHNRVALVRKGCQLGLF